MKGEANFSDALANLAFRVQFSETNLLWLALEPESFETRQLREFHLQQIKLAQFEIQKLKGGAR